VPPEALDEGEEVLLVSNLTLRRGLIHKEPAIELCGADPFKFAELRGWALSMSKPIGNNASLFRAMRQAGSIFSKRYSNAIPYF
jgi:hypothetical protein